MPSDRFGKVGPAGTERAGEGLDEREATARAARVTGAALEARATPPSTVAPLRTRRTDAGSPRSTTPAVAARTGTESWRVAARVAARSRTAAYQSTAPRVEASVPEARAKASCAGVSADWRASRTQSAVATIGSARRWLPAATATGSGRPRPRSEYRPQVRPATPMRRRWAGDGAEAPGATSTRSPPRPRTAPPACALPSRSPPPRPATNIVTWTVPKNTSAPVPLSNAVKAAVLAAGESTSRRAESQLPGGAPPEGGRGRPGFVERRRSSADTTARGTAAESTRTVAKAIGSLAGAAMAARLRIALAAKAATAPPAKRVVRRVDLVGRADTGTERADATGASCGWVIVSVRAAIVVPPRAAGESGSRRRPSLREESRGTATRKGGGRAATGCNPGRPQA